MDVALMHRVSAAIISSYSGYWPSVENKEENDPVGRISVLARMERGKTTPHPHMLNLFFSQ